MKDEGKDTILYLPDFIQNAMNFLTKHGIRKVRTSITSHPFLSICSNPTFFRLLHLQECEMRDFLNFNSHFNFLLEKKENIFCLSKTCLVFHSKMESKYKLRKKNVNDKQLIITRFLPSSLLPLLFLPSFLA